MQTNELAKHIANACVPPCVIYLQGQLGAGKTTLVRGILQALGITGRVKSPTFTLVEPYRIRDYHIYHFDLYRLTTPAELVTIGIDDYCSADSICLIEWPEKGGEQLPLADVICHIMHTGQVEEQRCIKLSAQSTHGNQLLAQVAHVVTKAKS